MADPLRHRQTKGAATDMVDLTPPRHIPTLPNLAVQPRRLEWRVCAVEPPFIGSQLIGKVRPLRAIPHHASGFAARSLIVKTPEQPRQCRIDGATRSLWLGWRLGDN